MATPTLRPPVDSELLIKEARNSRPWLNFFRQLARLFTNMRAVASITTADVAAAAAITLNPVTTADVTAVSSPLITSADADATYSANEQTLINELKTDVNALVVIQNADKDLTNELKADLNTLSSQLQDTRTQLNATIALVNELKAAHNSIITSVTE